MVAMAAEPLVSRYCPRAFERPPPPEHYRSALLLGGGGIKIQIDAAVRVINAQRVYDLDAEEIVNIWSGVGARGGHHPAGGAAPEGPPGDGGPCLHRGRGGEIEKEAKSRPEQVEMMLKGRKGEKKGSEVKQTRRQMVQEMK